ncbi:hypothetical protein Dcar01_02824 [Deinococcus carri]|uniref:Polysaccharide biosynthesis protein n=1 Tax=Deinococcus carri TaxID=1211323 RepID=A0ABP9WDA3_9DEIO
MRGFSFIILLPFLTRVIQPLTWGALLSAQALGLWLILLLDFGFTLSLSRKIAILRGDVGQVSRDVGNVISAKILLSLFAVLITYLVSHQPAIVNYQSFAWLALLWAITQSFSPLWFYQAVERMVEFSIIDMIGRVVYILSILIFVRGNSDAYLVLLLQALTLIVVNFLTISRMWKSIGGFSLSLWGGFEAIREGYVLSGFTLLTSLYTAAGTFMFGFFAPPALVPVYGNADRLARAGVSLLGPLNQLLLPRSARAFAESHQKGFTLVKRFLLFYSLIGLLGFVAGWLLAPFAVHLLFGKSYIKSVHYLRWLMVLFPLTAFNTVLVYHFLIPLARDKIVTFIYTMISFITLCLIFLLVPRYRGDGMIIAMIFPEFLALIILSLIYFKAYRRYNNA